ncbi:MAG: hypothetical protein JOY56_02475 [Solirubrobacterales bacterium]|nr:hypothetical protein [Solirubrobacterales bacterium]
MLTIGGRRDGQPSTRAPAAPRRILCLGVNYADHAAKGGRAPATWPEVFVPPMEGTPA